jgi:hypothetical protein
MLSVELRSSPCYHLPASVYLSKPGTKLERRLTIKFSVELYNFSVELCVIFILLHRPRQVRFFLQVFHFGHMYFFELAEAIPHNISTKIKYGGMRYVKLPLCADNG